MRRKDREITDTARILDILDRCTVVRLGFCAGDTPYIVPMHFAYTFTNGVISLFVHGAKEGRKMELLQHNNRVCFEADILHETVRMPSACDWTARYESVMGEGTASLVTDAKENEAALAHLLRRYRHTGDIDMDAAAVAQTAVLRIEVSALSGKCSGVPTDTANK